MSHSVAELAVLAQCALAERLHRRGDGEWLFRTNTSARPRRIALLRQSGMSTKEIIEQFDELTPVDVKVARISSYLSPEDVLERLDLLTRPQYAELVMRLRELAALLHRDAVCCREDPESHVTRWPHAEDERRELFPTRK